MTPILDPRCPQCGRKLALKIEGRVEMYCPRCKRFVVFVSRDLTEQLDHVIIGQPKMGAPS